MASINPERLRQIEELYHLAAERVPGDREDFLREACPNDAGLLQDVLSLFAQDPSAGPMERPIFEVAGRLLGDAPDTPWTPGTRVGPYEIVSRLGEGGMGDVFRALDTRLGREVAIKTTKEEFSGRFQREARAISALNHPHICTLHDIGPNYLVMELVEGETLAARLQKGRLPMDVVVRYGSQIANALAAAYSKGITHRDLKPTNIMVTNAGIKLLDFGLAKFAENADPATSQADTATASQTIVGTPAYMAPEQLEGKACDARTDIFALGVVLYEMAAGRQPFKADSRAALAAEILRCEPPPLGPVKPQFAYVVERCLAKDPENRWQSARDIELLLGACVALDEKRGTEVPGQAETRPTWPVAAAVLAIALVVTGVGWWRARRPVEHPLTRLSVDLGPEAVRGLNTTVVISPDGRRLVFPVRGPDGKQQLATRLLDQAQATLLPDTENGSDPFFSPNGQWIGFFAGGQLKKISVQGGAPLSLCTAATPLGASWGEDGSIIAALNQPTPLSRVPAAGGAPQPLTMLGTGEITHRWPQVLPGGGAVLFTASPTHIGLEDANIEALSLKTGQVKILQRGGYYGQYLPSGHLVYVHQGVLFGVEFDAGRLEVRGTPTPLLGDLAANPISGGGQFGFSGVASGPGALVYLAGKAAAQSWQVAWLDSSGHMQPLIRTPGAYVVPRFSPDGRKLAFINGTDIFIHDLERDIGHRLTFNADARSPVWTPDGKHIAFEAVSGGFSLSWIRSDGAGEPQRLLAQANPVDSWSFASDGRRLAYLEANPETGFDLWTLPLDLTDPDRPKPGKPELFLRTPADELVPRFSPDGRWIAYRSNESGNNEIYVRPFPARGGGKWQVSTGGGLYGIWSNNGRELFYETTDNRIMVLDYTVNGDSFVPGKPRLWSGKQIFYPGSSNLDLAPDGKRFAVLTAPEAAGGEKGSLHVTMLLNFFDEVKRRIPVGGK